MGRGEGGKVVKGGREEGGGGDSYIIDMHSELLKYHRDRYQNCFMSVVPLYVLLTFKCGLQI